MSERLYCAYCGRVTHRCSCDATDSKLRQFLTRHPDAPAYQAKTMSTPYKRGVPPQIKRRERAILRKNYDEWYTLLATRDGEQCCHCQAQADDDKLVLDHIISIAKGGTSVIENLQILCAECNRIKGKLCIDCRPNT